LEPALGDRRTQIVCDLPERLPGVVRINFAHVEQRTQLRHIAVLANINLSSLSKSSNLDVVAAVAAAAQAVATDETTPAGAGTPAGAYTEPLGETMQVNGTRLLRVRAVADMFDVSVSTIYRAIEAGQLASLKIGTGKGAIRIPADAVESFAVLCAGTSAPGLGAHIADERSVGGAA
jgi:excisionase family DNA binding protein